MRILVTGGAGFIGSHLADALVAAGDEVVLYDNLDPQVHGPARERPRYLDPDLPLVVGDIRNSELLRHTLLEHRIDAIFHEAAAVGVGQSMYQLRKYTDVNTVGTAALLEALVDTKHPIQKIVVASSMSIYGEGSYVCPEHGLVAPRPRGQEQMAERRWEMECPSCGGQVTARATREDKPLVPTSVYATTKRDQEELVLEFGQAYDVPAVALRYFNVYGERQALSNPYTGVAAIFASSLLNGNAPRVFEDGKQSRDFTHVSDIVAANLLALRSDAANGGSFNVGTGIPTSIERVAVVLAEKLGVDVGIELLGMSRAGDIRHCYADIELTKSTLGFEPRVTFEDGMEELAKWLQGEHAEDRGAAALEELATHKLAR